MIYLLEDDKSIRELVVYTLESQDMEIEGFDTPSKFYDAMNNRIPELVILDIMLPEESGLDVLEKIRTREIGHNIMVLMLTAKSTEYDKVVGLNKGADDYLAKPFGMMELIARVKALLRRRETFEDKNNFIFGDMTLDIAKHQLYINGIPIKLTLKEFGLLEIFVKNIGIVFTRNQLIEKNWGYEFLGDTRTVDVHIRTLRRKLGNLGELIKTVHGIGYKLEK